MAFLEFEVGNNNYELRDVTDENVLGGIYYQTSLTETSVVYSLVCLGETEKVVGHVFGDVCKVLKTNKMVFSKSVNSYGTATDQLAMEYAIGYLSGPHPSPSTIQP